MGETQPDWVPPGVDTKRANVARIYDYWLGGTHNFLADQDVGRAIAAVEPRMRAIAQANRAFLGRAVRYLSAEGIDQFLDRLVYVSTWRPDSPADVADDLAEYGALGGVARKP